MSQPNGKQYQLKYTSGVKTALKLLADNVREDIIEAINELTFNPEPDDSIQLRDPYVTHRRIAIGRYRIVYKVKEEDNQIWIVSVKKRGPATYNYLTQN